MILEAGGRRLFYTKCSYNRSTDNVPGTFNATLSLTGQSVAAWEPIRITNNGRVEFIGYIEEIASSGSDTTASITISGRDLLSDIVDSSVPDSVKVSGVTTLDQMAKAIISALGANIKVINLAGDLTLTEIQAASTGTKAFDYLQGFARKLGVYLIPDAQGNLVIFKNTNLSRSSVQIVNAPDTALHNVKSWNKKIRTDNMYCLYHCKSQENYTATLGDDYSAGSSISGSAADPISRPSRYLEITAEESMDADKCKSRAGEEANIRRARGTEYEATIAGINNDIEISKAINVDDDAAGVSGVFIVRSFEKEVSGSGDSWTAETKVTVAPIDAYTSEEATDKKSGRKSKVKGRHKKAVDVSSLGF